MDWQHKLAGLIEALNRQDFPALFLKAMRSVADFDSSVIMAYGWDRARKSSTTNSPGNSATPSTSATWCRRHSC